jgi:Mg2+ and Co2+ transporter CorA
MQKAPVIANEGFAFLAIQRNRNKMKEEFDLHSLAVEDALIGHQSSKISDYVKVTYLEIRTV